MPLRSFLWRIACGSSFSFEFMGGVGLHKVEHNVFSDLPLHNCSNYGKLHKRLLQNCNYKLLQHFLIWFELWTLWKSLTLFFVMCSFGFIFQVHVGQRNTFHPESEFSGRPWQLFLQEFTVFWWIHFALDKPSRACCTDVSKQHEALKLICNFMTSGLHQWWFKYVWIKWWNTYAINYILFYIGTLYLVDFAASNFIENLWLISSLLYPQ